MTPAERANLEYLYDRLYDLQDRGEIRPLELEQMQQISQQLMPVWQSEYNTANAPIEPMLMNRDTTTEEDVGNWFGDKIRRVSGDTPWPMSERDSYAMGRKVANIGNFIPPLSGMMAGDQIGRDIGAGNYGSAALNLIGTAAEVIPVVKAGNFGMNAIKSTKGSLRGLLGQQF